MKNSFTINIAFLVLAIVGLALAPKLSLQLHPQEKEQRIYIRYQWKNMIAEVIEKEVTSPLEGIVSSVDGVKNVGSKSSRGSGIITLYFKEEVDIDIARFEVSSLVESAYPNLPEGVSRPSVSYQSHDEESDPLLMVYCINGEGNRAQLADYAEENIAPFIRQLDEIGTVAIQGATTQRYEIKYNTFALLTAGITPMEVRSGINNYFDSRELGGMVDDDGQNTFLTFEGQNSDSIQWDDVILSKSQDRIVRLTDVATINKCEQKPRSYFRVNGLNTIYLTIYTEKGMNQVKAAKAVKEKVEELSTQFPNNFAMMINYDASERIEKEINKISSRALMAIGILLLFVLVISRRWRYLMIILLSLLANISVALLFYKIFGVEIHLYSLAGITVSLGILIDNTIIMVDHLRHTGNRKAFLAILAATLTTIGSLTVIFFLKEEQQMNLIDFALVMIINLAVSLFVALWLTPALMTHLPLGIIHSKRYFKQKRRTARWSRRYSSTISFCSRKRWLFMVVAIWGFGLPLFLLPEKIEIDEQKGEEPTFWTDLYNNTLGNDTYVSKVRPWVNKILGGSLNYFVSYTDHSSMSWDDQQTQLTVSMSMPDGATLEQMNEVFLEWENHIAQYPQVDKFTSRIHSIDNARIQITFTEEGDAEGFPYFLKQNLETKATQTGSTDCAIWGVGRGFNNSLYEGAKQCRIELKGYNYDKLVFFARNLKDSLLEHPRIQEVIVQTGNAWRNKPRFEFVMKLDQEKLAQKRSTIEHTYNMLSALSAYELYCGTSFEDNRLVPIYAKDADEEFSSTWNFNNNILVGDNNNFYRLSEIGSIEKERAGNVINKWNQQYTINVEYDFIGSYQLSRMVLERNIERLEEELPLGFTAKNNKRSWSWNNKEKTQYWLLFLVIGIIYMICAILLESLLQPLAVIATIPIAFIGVFLTFALFKLKFDQGGYASMILLCGLTVNAALYIINDYNNNRRTRPLASVRQCYIKAYNHKIIPILLTILSTSLGLIPFLIDGKDEGFWFSLACGAIGGLLFSMVAVPIWLPMLLRRV